MPLIIQGQLRTRHFLRCLHTKRNYVSIRSMKLCSKHDFPVALHKPLQLSHDLSNSAMSCHSLSFGTLKAHQWPLHQWILQVFSPHRDAQLPSWTNGTRQHTTICKMERPQWCVNLFLLVYVALSLGSKVSSKYRRSLVKGTGQNQITKKMHGQKWTCAAQRLHLCSLLNLQIVLTKTSLQHQLLQFVAPCCGSCNKRSISIDIPGDQPLSKNASCDYLPILKNQHVQVQIQRSSRSRFPRLHAVCNELRCKESLHLEGL